MQSLLSEFVDEKQLVGGVERSQGLLSRHRPQAYVIICGDFNQLKPVNDRVSEKTLA